MTVFVTDAEDEDEELGILGVRCDTVNIVGVVGIVGILGIVYILGIGTTFKGPATSGMEEWKIAFQMFSNNCPST